MSARALALHSSLKNSLHGGLYNCSHAPVARLEEWIVIGDGPTGPWLRPVGFQRVREIVRPRRFERDDIMLAF